MKNYIGMDDWGDDLGKPLGNQAYTPCYSTHPSFKVGNGTIYGGNAGSPMETKADIYVSLSGSSSGYQSDPWEEQKVVEVNFYIPDGGVPSQVKRFKRMIDWLCNQLQLGKTIHVGCIGGHGRTGMVLSAILAKMGTKKAIQYVRKHYCKKAVENKTQVEFLVKHFGVADAPAAKEKFLPMPWKNDNYSTGTSTTKKYTPYTTQPPSGFRYIHPVQAEKKSIWIAESGKLPF